MSDWRNQPCLFRSSVVALALLSATFLPPGLVGADQPDAEADEPGEIKTEAISDVLPRDRSEFGIGEHVYVWIERPRPKRPDPRAAGRQVAPRNELRDFVVWTATDNSTMLPTITRIGDRTILAVGLSDRDSQLSIAADFLKPAGAIHDQLAKWEPAAPARGPAQPDPPVADDKNAVAAGAGDPAWKKKLYRLCDLRKARETPFDDVERLAREIFSEPLADGDQALVYFHLAELYAQSGMVHPDRVLEYSCLALALPLEPSQRTTLFIYRGDACLARRAGATFNERRRAAAFEYARGLAEIARHDLPVKPRERQLTTIFSGDDDDGEGKQQMQKVRDFNARVDFETTLLQHRDLIRQQLKALFFPGP
jgi:hypothetical protein